MTEPPRNRGQRRQDTLDRLAHDADAWVATADGKTGAAYLIPLSFRWDGTDLLVATPEASVTARNLQAAGRTRLGVGPTRDLVMIEGEVREVLPAARVADEVGDAFAAKSGFDPRRIDEDFLYFRIRPTRIQAWREADEIKGRELMRDGQWIDAD